MHADRAKAIVAKIDKKQNFFFFTQNSEFVVFRGRI
jgi:hypothetical protein